MSTDSLVTAETLSDAGANDVSYAYRRPGHAVDGQLPLVLARSAQLREERTVALLGSTWTHLVKMTFTASPPAQHHRRTNPTQEPRQSEYVCRWDLCAEASWHSTWWSWAADRRAV